MIVHKIPIPIPVIFVLTVISTESICLILNNFLSTTKNIVEYKSGRI